MRSERHLIKKDNTHYDLFATMLALSNNLYNHALFIVRQNFIHNLTQDGERKFLNYNAIDKVLRKMQEENYNALPAQTAQQILRVLDKNWKSFFKAIKQWSRNPGAFKGMPKMPGYRKKGGFNQLIFTNQQCKFKDGYITFPKMFDGFKIKVANENITGINQVRIIPHNQHFVVEIVYQQQEPKEMKSDNQRYIGIDLGLDNFVAIASNCSQAIIINGKGLKSQNKYFNDKIDKRKSQLGKCQKKQYSSNKLEKLWYKRQCVMENFLHKVSREIVNYCLDNNINKVVIGHNKGQKQNLRMKNFTQIPMFALIQKLKYKLEQEGIELIETEENYTSGTSFLDNELPTKANYDKSRRVERGLFSSNNGIKINADVNGAFQILKKVFGDVEKPADNGFVFNPVQLIIT